MRTRGRIILILLVLTVGSFWLAERLDEDETKEAVKVEPIPDYTMTDVNSLNMNAEGEPQSRLQAEYLEHFETQARTELHEPRLELFRPARAALHVSAKRGWVTSGNETILLRGDVRFWEPAAEGAPVFEITTSEAYIYPQREYAETDKPATLTTRQSRTEGVGMRAYLQEQRIEMLNQVHTRIEAGAFSGVKP